mgnify:CR=1 FL=1|tara:strand:+ start:553 stop:930 length:378 start_codon:yes stop_codon:yes gene_type:complete
MSLSHVLIVGAGGFLGAVLRAWIGVLCKASTQSFPWDVLAINLAGSLLLGLVMGWTQSQEVGEEMQYFLGVGLCGGFTTFSTFSYQTWELFKDGRILGAGLNIALSVILCILGAWFGFALARKLT